MDLNTEYFISNLNIPTDYYCLIELLLRFRTQRKRKKLLVVSSSCITHFLLLYSHDHSHKSIMTAITFSQKNGSDLSVTSFYEYKNISLFHKETFETTLVSLVDMT